MKAGIEKSSGLIDGMDKEVVNKMKIAPKFICYEQKAESV
jgi:hypothetical protein